MVRLKGGVIVVMIGLSITNLLQTFPASLAPNDSWEKAQAQVQNTVFTCIEGTDIYCTPLLAALLAEVGIGK